jgi:hypothetical protein
VAFEDLVHYSLYSLVFHRLKCKMTISCSNSKEHAQTNLQYLRKVREDSLHDHVGPEYLAAVQQTVDALRWTCRNMEDKESLSFVNVAAKYLLEDYLMYDLQQQTLLPVHAAELYEVLAESAFKEGHVGIYLRNMFLSRYIAAAVTTSKVRDQEEWRRFALVEDQLLWALENEGTDETMTLHDTVKLQLLSLKCFEDSNVPVGEKLIDGAVSDRVVAPLKTMTRDLLVKSYHQHLKAMSKLLQSPGIEKAFLEVARRIDIAGSFWRPWLF